MERKKKILNSKDRRSNSCLDRTISRDTNENRTSSFNEQLTQDSSIESISKHSTPTHELYKLQKQSYENAKKRITSELDYILKDSSGVIISDWLKVRGTFRDWTKLWAILKPGLILFYRNLPSMNGVWVGTIILSSCQAMQRPSKKSGFCFKIWHPLEKSIWTQKGPNNEQFGAFIFPLPINYLICRASDETTGRCWIDALELTMKCSKLLQRPYLISSTNDDNINSTDIELNLNQDIIKEENIPNETLYILAPAEEMGEIHTNQIEEVTEENKSLIMHLLKQIRPGMDLSKVILPTFILEPRSLLEKFSDYYYHCDILEEAVNASDPLLRMKTIVKFYLSGFYKKPKGLKKPYNPVLGEVYRCYFHHPKNDSKTFYIAEQISHHPPITNIYVSNRKEGFCIQGSILTKSKYYGNSLSAILDGTVRITLLNKEEDYIITMPYAHCKGVLIGRLTMELGGKVTIICEKTKYSADIEFKLKPFIGGQELMNFIEGKIRFEQDVLYKFSGHWDDEIILLDKTTNTKTIFWKVTQSIIHSRLKRFVVPIEQQQNNESEKLWRYVTSAIRQNDQTLATKEKTIIENEQRKQLKERQLIGTEWYPHLFHIDPNTNNWIYIHADVRPWDSQNDLSTYENNFIISTRTRHTLSLSIHNNIEEKSLDNDVVSILKRLERNLIDINVRIESHNKEIHCLKTRPTTNNNDIDFSSFYIHFILLIFVVIILRYIF